MVERPDDTPRSAPQLVYAKLRDAIMEGSLPGGQPLRQDDLAARYGVSRSPVREALRRLEAEGLVAYETHRGAVVSSISLDDALEMLEIRIALECRALRLAIPNMTDGDFARIDAVLEAYGQGTEADDLARLNRDFHLALYAPADRPRLLALIRDNFDKAGRFSRVQVSIAAGHDRPHREHRAIREACRAGDIERASRLLEEHLAYSQKALVAAVRRPGAIPSAGTPERRRAGRRA